MTEARPFEKDTVVVSTASDVWSALTMESVLEAFAAHPRIGDIESLQAKYSNTTDWAEGEQAGAASANEETISNLAARNDEYLEKFGYIFIVCATGKSAKEMLEILEARLPNDPDSELKIAGQEQLKITLLRLNKLVEAPVEREKSSHRGQPALNIFQSHPTKVTMSPITTHVLDTSLGKPAAGITVCIEMKTPAEWSQLGNGITNEDGRVTDLMEAGTLTAGHYRLTFATAEYFAAQNVEGFYPQVQIEFEINQTNQHYHVPLLLNPFGYSTYRGS